MHACDVAADGVALDLSNGRVRIHERPDERHAMRACRLATRVLAVEFSGLDSDEPRARLTAVWHRVPHTRAITVAGGLALTFAGVPSYVVVEVES